MSDGYNSDAARDEIAEQEEERRMDEYYSNEMDIYNSENHYYSDCESYAEETKTEETIEKYDEIELNNEEIENTHIIPSNNENIFIYLYKMTIQYIKNILR